MPLGFKLKLQLVHIPVAAQHESMPDSLRFTGLRYYIM